MPKKPTKYNKGKNTYFTDEGIEQPIKEKKDKKTYIDFLHPNREDLENIIEETNIPNAPLPKSKKDLEKVWEEKLLIDDEEIPDEAMMLNMLDAENEFLMNENIELKTENADLLKLIEYKQNYLENLEKELDEARKILNDTQVRNVDLKDGIREQQKEIQEVKTKLKEHEIEETDEEEEEHDSLGSYHDKILE